MAAPDVGACVSAGYNGFKKDPVTHIVATLLVIIIGNVSAGLLLGPMIVGYMRLIKIQEDGGTPQIGDVFKGFDDFVPALLAGLVSGILVAIGFMLCILPGLLIMAILPTATYLVAVGEKDGINAIKRAWVVVKQNLLGAFLCSLVLGILGQVGVILCFIGLLLTLPISFIGMYQMAKQLTDGGAAANA